MNPSNELFYIVSVGHTQRRDPYILLWNPNNAGYCYRTEIAGKYTHADVSESSNYYNSGDNTLAVKCSALDAITTPSKKGYLDNDGSVIPNNAKSWQVIRDALFALPKNPINANYRGAPKIKSMKAKQERLIAANKFIETIASCGRKFFSHEGFTSTMELSKQGRVFFIDHYTKKRIYTHKHGRWNGFTSGGTMKSLIVNLRDFITTGDTLSAAYFQPDMGNGFKNPWGYGEDILIVKQSAIELGIAK